MDTTVILFIVAVLCLTVVLIVFIHYVFRFISEVFTILKAKDVQEVIDARKEYVFNGLPDDDKDVESAVMDVSEITLSDLEKNK